MSDEKLKKPMAKPRMGGGGAFGGGIGMTEKPKNFKKTMHNLMVYLKPFYISITFVIIFAITSTIFAIVSPKILGNATNTLVTGFVNRQIYDQVYAHLPAGVTLPKGTTGEDVLKNLPQSQIDKIPTAQLNKVKKLDLTHRPGIDFDAIQQIGILLIVLYVLSSLFNYIQGYIMTNVSQEVVYRMRRDIGQKINELPLRYFDNTTYGEVLSRLTNDVTLVSQSLNQSLTQIITSVTLIIGILIMMFSISWIMTLVAILMLPISFVVVAYLVKRSQPHFVNQQKRLGKINGHIEEMFSGHTVMKVYNGKEKSIKTFEEINGSLYESAWKSQFLSGLMMPIISIMNNLSFVAISVLGGYLAVLGKISIGDIQAFIQYINQFSQPISAVANIANILQSTAAASERIFEFLEEPAEANDAVSPIKLIKPQGHVEFDHVEFGYNSKEKIIKDFTANIKAGSRVAIVGPTGAGKTTLVNLLMRFYEIDKGQIKIDGVNTKDMTRSDVRKLFGMVLQDTWLFNGTIAENIAYGKPNATRKDIIEAAQAAHADHFIKALPESYDLVLNEEADNISQGEKQLLTIARAMLADTPMLILDEATSSVDTRTEVLIQKAMDKLMIGKTSFVIAHRLSTIRNADLILVMDHGNIVEQGTHNQLLKNKGFYYDLYNSQFAAPMVEATPLKPALN